MNFILWIRFIASSEIIYSQIGQNYPLRKLLWREGHTNKKHIEIGN